MTSSYGRGKSEPFGFSNDQDSLMGSYRPIEAILWAHRGASALARDNTLEAFRLAIHLGATGLESDVHLAREGIPVLVHDPRVRRGGRWITVASRTVDELARWQIPSLANLYEAVGTDVPLSLDLNDVRVDATATAVIEAARAAGGDAAVRRLHLCLGDLGQLEALAARYPGVTWVHSADPSSLGVGVGAHAARLAGAGIGVLNMKWPGWGGAAAARAAVDAVHGAGLRAFAWDTQRAAIAARLLRAGIDGVYADDPRQLVRAAQMFTASRGRERGPGLSSR
jgi:glycerophosphoryl diester phosphodiesterase